MEVTQSIFASMAGVNRASICVGIKKKSLVMNSAGKLDTDNPVNRRYLDKHQAKLRDAHSFETFGEQVPAAVVRQAVSVTPKNLESDKNGVAGEMLNLTLRELIQQHGNMANVERYAKLVKDLTVADEKEQRIQERRLEQIPKDFVQASVFGFLESLMNKLLDMPERFADQAVAFVQSDVDSARGKIKNLLSDDITAAITDSKNQIINGIENMKGRYSQEDNLRDIVSEAMEKAE